MCQDGLRARVMCQDGWREWCAIVDEVGGILKPVALVILDEITGWCTRQNHGWRNVSQTLS